MRRRVGRRRCPHLDFAVSDLGWTFLACGGGLLLASVGIRFLVRGTGGRFKIGNAEVSIDTSMLTEIHQSVQEINRAVNHQGPGDPVLIDRVIAIERKLDGVIDRFDIHRDIAMAWQRDVAKALPDTAFPDPG